MAEIKELNLEKRFPQQQELLDRIIALIYEYSGEISAATAIGLLDLAKDEIKDQQ